MKLRVLLHTQKKREEGYELFLTVRDDDTGLDVLGNQTVSSGENGLWGADLEDFINKVYLPRVEAMLTAAPEEDELLLKSDVEQLLIVKGYLAEGKTLEDLPDKAQ